MKAVSLFRINSLHAGDDEAHWNCKPFLGVAPPALIMVFLRIFDELDLKKPIDDILSHIETLLKEFLVTDNRVISDPVKVLLTDFDQ